MKRLFIFTILFLSTAAFCDVLYYEGKKMGEIPPVKYHNGSLIVPLRAIGEKLGYEIVVEKRFMGTQIGTKRGGIIRTQPPIMIGDTGYVHSAFFIDHAITKKGDKLFIRPLTRSERVSKQRRLNSSIPEHSSRKQHISGDWVSIKVLKRHDIEWDERKKAFYDRSDYKYKLLLRFDNFPEEFEENRVKRVNGIKIKKLDGKLLFHKNDLMRSGVLDKKKFS